MAELVVMYKTPKDAAAFDKHYAEKHVPLAKKIPGLRKYTVSQGPVATPAGPSAFHLIATLTFDNLAAIQAGVASAHSPVIRNVTPSALGSEECLKTGSVWLHLRICRSCGYVGCCDDSPNKHATRHFHATGHPIIQGYDPPEGWGWCYVDEIVFDLSKRKTPHNGPIPRYY